MSATAPVPTPANEVLQAAQDFGIDLTLIASNLRLTPAERIRQLDATLRFEHGVRVRKMSPAQRDALEARELAAKVASLGGDPLVEG